MHGVALQSLVLTYDAVGNVTARRDLAQPTIYFQNAASPPVAVYTYDSLYRLIQATGRESALSPEQSAPPAIGSGPATVKAPLTSQQVRPYQQTFQYDEVGNLTQMTHVPLTAAGIASGWQRVYQYEAKSSRLVTTQIEQVVAEYLHDSAGNLVKMPQLLGGAAGGLSWDWANRLRQTALTAQQVTRYSYTHDAQRRQKVTGTAQSGTQQVTRRVLYLPGGLEVVQTLSGGGVTAEWQTVAIDDGQVCLTRAEVQTVGGLVNAENPVVRYQVQDQVGSVSMELTDQGDVLRVEEFYPYGDTAYWTQREGGGYSRKRYRYNGKERDEESGLYYYGARYYAPWLGRWTACDPTPAVGVSPFEFCSGNPGSRVDLDGRWPLDPQAVFQPGQATAAAKAATAVGRAVIGATKQAASEALKGDFNQGPTTLFGQVAAVGVGLIPVVGQVADVRDAFAAVKGVLESPKSGGAWAGLGMAAVAFFARCWRRAEGGV